jgi:hypothetical protein
MGTDPKKIAKARKDYGRRINGMHDDRSEPGSYKETKRQSISDSITAVRQAFKK